MRETQLHAVGGQLLTEFTVTEDATALLGNAAPGGQVHLIDRHGARPRVAATPGLHPEGVVPDEAGEVADDGGVVGRRLEVEAVGIRLEERSPVVRPDELELVTGADGEAGHENFPDAGSAQGAHRVGAAVP